MYHALLRKARHYKNYQDVYKRQINATAGSGYNWISEKAQLNLGFTYGDRFFPSFSISYAGNMVGVALTTEGECGLDMELQRATRGFHSCLLYTSSNC